MTMVSFGFITGFMLGLEFPPQMDEEEHAWLVIDLGIVRIVFTKMMENE